MRYDLDLTKIPLDAYRELLKRQILLPSRRMLLDGLDGNFMRLGALGIGTAADLLRVLASPAKIAELAAASGVSADYLKILKREAGTLRQKPVPLSAFSDTDPAQIEALSAQGMKTSKDYYERGNSGGRLYALCDLVRVNGVGPNAAAMFCAAGYHSAADIAGADAKALLKSVSAVNAEKRYYAGTLGEKDMQFCIDFANILLQYAA